MKRIALASLALFLCVSVSGCAAAGDALHAAEGAVASGGTLQVLCAQTAEQAKQTSGSPEFRSVLSGAVVLLQKAFELAPDDFPAKAESLKKLHKAAKQLDDPSTDTAAIAKTVASVCDVPAK